MKIGLSEPISEKNGRCVEGFSANIRCTDTIKSPRLFFASGWKCEGEVGRMTPRETIRSIASRSAGSPGRSSSLTLGAAGSLSGEGVVT